MLRIVTGKGGVGKTVVSTALALAEARQGKRVLLAEVNGRDRVAALLGAEPVGSKVREVLDRLYVVDMNPRDALHEYALLVLRFEAVYRAVFENRLVQRFVRLVPSLAELMLLGKLWYHAEQRDPRGSKLYDVQVLDAPATGHALELLGAPAAVEQTVPPGPLREITRRLRDQLTDRNRTVLHVVTTPEEMPVTETLEILGAATDRLHIALGELIINQRLGPIPEPAWQHLAATDDDPVLGGIRRVLELREGRRRAGEEHLERLPADVLAGAYSLPRVVTPQLGREAIERLAEVLAPLVAKGPVS